jgi:hypothetical protein
MTSIYQFKERLTQIGRLVPTVAFLYLIQPVLFSSMPALAEAMPSSISKDPLFIVKNRSLPARTGSIAQADRGTLEVSNGNNLDAYVKLIEPNSRQLVSEFFVESNSNYTLNSIPDGTYRVIFALGKNWNSQTKSFAKRKSFAKFNKLLDFTTMERSNGIEYKIFKITLHPVAAGKARTRGVDESEFNRY